MARWIRTGALLVILVPVVGVAQDANFFSWFDGHPKQPYRLDGVSRYLDKPGRPDCPIDLLVRYRGANIRYSGHLDAVPWRYSMYGYDRAP